NYANRYVFSGFRTNTPSLSEDGKFLGDDGAVFLQIDDGDFRQINLQSRYLFEATPTEREMGHYNLVDSLQLLHSGLTDNNLDDIRRAMDEIEFQLQKSTSFQASIGALYSGLEGGGKKLEAEAIQTKVN